MYPAKQARAPQDITAGDILREVEGDLGPVECVNGGAESLCGRAEECVAIGLWRDVKRAMENVVDNRTLADLAAEYRTIAAARNKAEQAAARNERERP